MVPKKDIKPTILNAIKNMLEKNDLTEKDINVISASDDKVLLRFPNGNMDLTNNLQETDYHGFMFDIFVYKPITAKSGWLAFDEVLTDDYRLRCQ